MKSFIAIFCSLAALVAANATAADAFAQEMRFRPSNQAPASRSEPPRRPAASPAPQRDMRGSGGVDRGRMSDDERRQLRRDIRDAGKDVYQPVQQERRDARHPGRR